MGDRRLNLVVSGAVAAWLLMVPTPAAANASAASAADAAFAHPGVLVSKAQLDTAKARVNAGTQPWRGAYDEMSDSEYASLTREPEPREIVECGPGSNPNHGCTDERGDAIAAYTQALLWYITEDTSHAEKAIEIMDAWSEVLTDHTGHNARLQTGWSGASFSRAAEIIKHTYPSWPQVDRFATLLRDVYLPEIRDGGGCTNGNWELIMMDAAVGIAVHLDDRAAFDDAVDIWRGRVPGYVYLASDGSQPKAPSTCPGKDTHDEIVDYWQGQTRFETGLAQETCRDFGHTGWGISAMAHVAETAWHQGVNLYDEAKDRLTKASYFHARYELGAQVPSWLCGGSVDKGFGATTEVLVNHYRNRLNLEMDTSQQYTESKRPAGADYFQAWETLTHADSP